MKVIIVRHAQTTENAKTQNIGHNNTAVLTEEGIMQAQKLGEYLKDERITHVYTSPQKRAVHTAEKILQHHPLAKMNHVEELREQGLGAAETLPKPVWKEMIKNSGQPWHLFKADKGESYAKLQERATTFFHELAKKHPNDTVLVVSHAGTIGVLLLDILEKELTEENYRVHQPKNTEFTIVEVFEDGRKEIHKLNSREHLN